MLNGDVVDALTFIVHADKAYARARRIAEKLKEKCRPYAEAWKPTADRLWQEKGK
jgi:translation elongation factor EF-4